MQLSRQHSDYSKTNNYGKASGRKERCRPMRPPKKRIYLENYLEFGFIEAMDKVKIECVMCGEKLANESMKPCKLKRHQNTKHPQTIGKPREFFLRKKELDRKSVV